MKTMMITETLLEDSDLNGMSVEELALRWPGAYLDLLVFYDETRVSLKRQRPETDDERRARLKEASKARKHQRNTIEKALEEAQQKVKTLTEALKHQG